MSYSSQQTTFNNQFQSPNTNKTYATAAFPQSIQSNYNVVNTNTTSNNQFTNMRAQPIQTIHPFQGSQQQSIQTVQQGNPGYTIANDNNYTAIRTDLYNNSNNRQVNQYQQSAVQYLPTQQSIQSQTINGSIQQSIVTHVHQVDHQPVIHELHHVQRDVNIVSVEDIEYEWKKQVAKLEGQKADLEIQVRRSKIPQIERREVIVEDQEAINALLQEIKDMEQQRDEFNQECDSLMAQLNQLQIDLENSEVSESDIRKNEDEIARLKKQFSNLNSDHHQKTSELMMAQAEIESIKKRKVTEVVTTTTNKQTVATRGSIVNSGKR